MTRLVRMPLVPSLFFGALIAAAFASPMLAADPASKPTRATPTRRARTPRRASTSDKSTQTEKQGEEPQAVSLLDALRKGQVAVDAEGTGDGRMTLSVTNRSGRPLRVILPPGLVASGATGQFGGMGGMGGGMGGMGGGMMGGGMGGMGGGMMGGGMGGMGGGMGRMGGGMGGRGMGGGMLTMPPQMGMMMLARIIMRFCGDRDSWDFSSMMGGMGMGMGGMGGMMGGGMGGMGGMMGGMGGGMRSVPPTGLPHATLQPGQTRHLPTRVVSLTQPDSTARVVLPQKGEKLQVGDIDQLTNNPQVQAALRRLAEDKAPAAVAQLVMWNVAVGYDWATLTRLSQGWANPQELALARRFVQELGEDRSAPEASDKTEKAPREQGRFYFQAEAQDASRTSLAGELTKLFDGQSVLGLKAEASRPDHPEGPSLACRLTIGADEAKVAVSVPDETGTAWRPLSEFTLPLKGDKDGQPKPLAVADAMVEGVLDRVVHAKLIEPARKAKHATRKEKGQQEVYQVRIENASPLILNGLALIGKHKSAGETKPGAMVGVCIAPGRSLTVPAPAELVERLGLKDGVRVLAVDLSGL